MKAKRSKGWKRDNLRHRTAYYKGRLHKIRPKQNIPDDLYYETFPEKLTKKGVIIDGETYRVGDKIIVNIREYEPGDNIMSGKWKREPKQVIGTIKFGSYTDGEQYGVYRHIGFYVEYKKEGKIEEKPLYDAIYNLNAEHQ
jgi:hypothetical protein